MSQPLFYGSIIFSVGGKSFGFFFQHSFLFLRIEIEISKLIKWVLVQIFLADLILVYWVPRNE
ncbi:hypothetical protein BV274_14845, partial [Lactiplantibacillus plantarum]